MSDKKRGLAPWDSILTDDESDQSTKPTPIVPEKLLEKTSEKCNISVEAEVARHIDPAKLDDVKLIGVRKSLTFRDKFVIALWVIGWSLIIVGLFAKVIQRM